MLDTEVSQTTSQVKVVEFLDGETPSIVTVKKSVNPSGHVRHFTLKTPVPDPALFQQLILQVQPGDEIIATVVNEWRETGRVSYLSAFSMPLLNAANVPALAATV